MELSDWNIKITGVLAPCRSGSSSLDQDLFFQILKKKITVQTLSHKSDRIWTRSPWREEEPFFFSFSLSFLFLDLISIRSWCGGWRKEGVGMCKKERKVVHENNFHVLKKASISHTKTLLFFQNFVTHPLIPHAPLEIKIWSYQIGNIWCVIKEWYKWCAKRNREDLSRTKPVRILFL